MLNRVAAGRQCALTVAGKRPITNTPCKGACPALIDPVAEHIQAGFFNRAATAPFVDCDRMRGILITGKNAGHIMMAPRAAPADIIARRKHNWDDGSGFSRT